MRSSVLSIHFTLTKLKLNAELDEVNKWTLSNFLFINKRKTEFVIFGTDARLSKATDTVVIKSGDYEINRVYD